METSRVRCRMNAAFRGGFAASLVADLASRTPSGFLQPHTVRGPCRMHGRERRATRSDYASTRSTFTTSSPQGALQGRLLAPPGLPLDEPDLTRRSCAPPRPVRRPQRGGPSNRLCAARRSASPPARMNSTARAGMKVWGPALRTDAPVNFTMALTCSHPASTDISAPDRVRNTFRILGLTPWYCLSAKKSSKASRRSTTRDMRTPFRGQPNTKRLLGSGGPETATRRASAEARQLASWTASSDDWWALWDSNPRPSDYESRALTD